MQPLQQLYGAPRLLPPPTTTTTLDDQGAEDPTLPFFFTHPYGRDNTTAAIVAEQACAVVEAWMAHDRSLTPEDVAVLATTTNQNAVFAQLQPKLCALYQRLGFFAGREGDGEDGSGSGGGGGGAVHFRTRFDVGTLTIDWDAAKGRTPMVSIHGEKGRGHRAVLLLDASSGCLPAKHRAGRAEALVDGSLLNVALTRSKRYLAVGFREGFPSAYFASRMRLDSPDPRVAGTAAAATEEEEEEAGGGGRLVWCSWAMPPPAETAAAGPERQPSRLHRALAQAVASPAGSPAARFSPTTVLLPERSDHPVKRMVAVSVDAAHAPEFEHPSDLVPAWSPGGWGAGPGGAAVDDGGDGLSAAAAAAFPFDDHVRYVSAAAAWRRRRWGRTRQEEDDEATTGSTDEDDTARSLLPPPPVPLRRERFGRPFALFRDAGARSRHAELAPVTGRLAELLLERLVKHDGACAAPTTGAGAARAGAGGAAAASSRPGDHDASPLAPSYGYLLERERHVYTDDELALNLAADGDLNRLARAANRRLEAAAAEAAAAAESAAADNAAAPSSPTTAAESDARRAVAAWLEAAEEAEARAKEMVGGRGARGGATAAALFAKLRHQAEGEAAEDARPLPPHLPYVLPSLVRRARVRRSVEAFLCPRTATRDLPPSSLWTLALAVALLHGEARRPALAAYLGEDDHDEDEEQDEELQGGRGSRRGRDKKAPTSTTTTGGRKKRRAPAAMPVRPEAYAQLLANVEGLAALLAREHYPSGGEGEGGAVSLSFEDDHSLRCRFPLDGNDSERALLGVGARSDVIVEDWAAAERFGLLTQQREAALPSPGFFSSPSPPPAAALAAAAAAAPFRRLLEIKCPAGGAAAGAADSATASAPAPSCANVWWNQALLYAVLSRRTVHTVSVADVAEGVLYSAPVALSEQERTAALSRVLKAFRFPEGARGMLSGLLRARVEAGRIEDGGGGAGGGAEEEEEEQEEEERRPKARRASKAAPSSSGLPPRYGGVAPGGGWALEQSLADSPVLEEARKRRTKKRGTATKGGTRKQQAEGG